MGTTFLLPPPGSEQPLVSYNFSNYLLLVLTPTLFMIYFCALGRLCNFLLQLQFQAACGCGCGACGTCTCSKTKDRGRTAVSTAGMRRQVNSACMVGCWQEVLWFVRSSCSQRATSKTQSPLEILKRLYCIIDGWAFYEGRGRGKSKRQGQRNAHGALEKEADLSKFQAAGAWCAALVVMAKAHAWLLMSC